MSQSAVVLLESKQMHERGGDDVWRPHQEETGNSCSTVYLQNAASYGAIFLYQPLHRQKVACEEPLQLLLFVCLFVAPHSYFVSTWKWIWLMVGCVLDKAARADWSRSFYLTVFISPTPPPTTTFFFFSWSFLLCVLHWSISGCLFSPWWFVWGTHIIWKRNQLLHQPTQ